MKNTSEKQIPMATMFSSKLAADQAKHRQLFLMELSSLMYLLRQGIAIRGHEEIQGNLYQLMKLRLKDIGVNDIDTTCMSPKIVNELISMM